MYMHAVYRIREFLSYKGFNLIFFSVHYQAILRDTSGSSGYEMLLNTASAVTMWANMLQRHILQFPPVRETADCVSSGRLREVKNN